MDVVYKRISPEGKIKIPKKILSSLGLKSGEKIKLNIVGKKVILESAETKNIPRLKLSEKIIDEIVEREELFEPEGM